jgi:hypothetical protein
MRGRRWGVRSPRTSGGTRTSWCRTAATAAISTNNLPAFGRLLRAHRAELLKLADVRQLSPDRALAFLERMGTLVMNDRVLISDYDAAVAKFGRAG